MSDEAPAIRIRAFVGRSFLKEDESLWYEIRTILESLRPIGFEFEDAKEAQLRPISDKVRQGIERNDFYIGILTRRAPIKDNIPQSNLLRRILSSFPNPKMPSQWTTSNWVVQESGYALGRAKKVLLLIEQGVDFPTADLDADTEWIPFERDIISHSSSRLVSMIGNLISEKLPAVSPTTQVGAPQETILPDEQRRVPPPGGDFARVVDLLNQREFKQADEEFERFLGPQAETPGDQWWRYFYLRLKSVRGHADSLQELKDIIQREPHNVDARVELARYYSYFEDYGNAARELMVGVDAALQESKATLLRHAAEELAKDNKHEKALEIIRDLFSRPTEPRELRLTYLSLANVAKSLSDRELESAALEHMLDLDPSDSGTRFRLAYLYGVTENRRLSTYHYKLRLDQGRDATALNNLGVGYHKLNLPAKGVEAFERASEDSWLAKANLSHVYIDHGFLDRGEELATDVTRADCDETARNRAASALSHVTTIRLAENQTEEKLLAEAREEKAFRSAYAEAFVAPAGTPINGQFETGHGNIILKQLGNRILGEKELEEQLFTPPTLATTLGGVTNPTTTVKNKILRFEASIVGRSGQLKIEIRDKNSRTFLNLMVRSSVIRGLLIIATDGKSFEVLENHETGARIYTATKISD